MFQDLICSETGDGWLERHDLRVWMLQRQPKGAREVAQRRMLCLLSLDRQASRLFAAGCLCSVLSSTEHCNVGRCDCNSFLNPTKACGRG
jgi:hypothetical protein